MAEFSNPNQQGGQDNRSLAVLMVVFIGVLLGLQYYRAKYAPVPAPQSATATQPNAKPAGPPTTQPNPPSATPTAPVVQAGSETTTVVENSLYRVTFSNRGAQVISWVLKGPQFTNSDGKPLDLVHDQAAGLFGYPLSVYTYDGTSLPISSASRSGNTVTIVTAGNVPQDLNGRAIAINGVSDSGYNGTYIVKVTGANTLVYTQDLVPSGSNANASGGSLTAVNGATGVQLGQALFVPSTTGSVSAPASISFKYSDGNLQATKTFTFDDSYVLHADVAVTRNGVPVQTLLSWPGGFGDQNETPNGSAYNSAQFDSDRNGKDDHLAPKKVSGGETLDGPFDWAGVSDPFFAAVFLPDSPGQARVVTLHNELDVAKTIKRVGLGSDSPPTKPLPMPILGAAVGDASGDTQTRIFVGPKAINVLKNIHAVNPHTTLEPLLEFGFWGFIGKYLFLALYFIHDHILHGISGAWGWAIVLLTIVINLLMLPFRIKTMQSALKMQRIQPQMDAIKERYKKYKVTDPKRNEMNAEIMQLQKDNGVNMFGGCIPQLITLPLLYAFFTMLPRVVEMRHASWLWLSNLQAADPLHILPVLTIVFQFLMQYYTPSPGVDPQQQRMMAFIMPAFFGYFTWNYASGIALYWLVGLVIGILTQMVINQTSIGREMRQIAEKRARRKGPPNQGRR